VADLRALLRGTFSSVIPASSPVALLDFPNYPNVGDSAIWLGTLAVLRELRCRLVYVCDNPSYSLEALEHRLPPGCPVLLQGGGSFGDLWPEGQRFRERVVGQLRHRPIIQLPSSIEFRSAAAAEQARATLNQHENLTLLCRDRDSLAYATEHFRARSLLCPDAALALTPTSRGPADVDLVVLQRSDHEALKPIPPLPGARVLDWSSAPGEPGHSRWWVGKQRLTRLVGRTRRGDERAERVRQALIRRLFDSLARQRVLFGFAVVTSGRLLVTDRLHGHILALLFGVPHVVVETGYGKIRSFHESFSRGLAGVTFLDGDGAVEAEVRRLRARRSGRY
jgi:exopolysaccharide biosynthesis predicted pyruvyltransferase EpsI